MWAKQELSSDNVLVLYDKNEQLILACNASTYGLFIL